MPSPSFALVSTEAFASGLVIALIGVISYYLYKGVGGYPSRKSGDAGSSSRLGPFWGMTASMFVVGAAFAYLSEYSGVNRRFCEKNYGR
jgi:hypothetical protein